MSILSCFGGAAESVRDMYLNRLQGATEVSVSTGGHRGKCVYRGPQM